jgi:hypothetical protein
MPTPEVTHLIELIAAALTVVALIFGWKQFLDARHHTLALQEHTAALSEHTAKLGNIENALSTRFIGKPSEYLKFITSRLAQATKSIFILCDYPAHLSFSYHSQYERYRNALREKINSEPKLEEIRLICLDRAHRDKLNREQFAGAIADWDSWRSSNRENLETLWKVHKDMLRKSHQISNLTLDDLTIGELFEMFEADDRRIIDDFSDIGVCEIPVDISIHIWIIDGHEAIFTIPALGGDVLEWGFFTSDNRLITAFRQLFERYAKV